MEDTSFTLLDMVCVMGVPATRAREIFLKTRSYTTLLLPAYIDFDSVLNNASQTLAGHELDHFCVKGRNIPNSRNVNYIVNYRDGGTTLRKYSLLNPAIYVSLLHLLTEETNWEYLCAVHSSSRDPRLSVIGSPVAHDRKGYDVSAMVQSWYWGVELASITMSGKYKHLIVTDVANCYGSMSPNSLQTALQGIRGSQSMAKAPNGLGNKIVKHLELASGPGGGLPAGCPLVHLLSELVFHYVDQQLMEKVKLSGGSKWDFQIIRFRDDYRIFCNDSNIGKSLVKALSEQLETMGMKLSPKKTKVYADVISGSLKPDKMDWLRHTPRQSFIEELLLIREFGIRYPNSGSVVKGLSRCLKNFKEIRLLGQLDPLIAILIDIMRTNPRTYPVGCALLSRFLMYEKDRSWRESVANLLMHRLSNLPDSECFNIWMQRVLLPYGYTITSTGNQVLLNIVNEREGVLWNVNWLKKDLKSAIMSTSIVDESMIGQLKKIIAPEEVCLFLESPEN